ncbi:torsin-2A-like [Sycon ciliatum]|uniref:torsin-2A-like n=1 Tax=Sycon ciliatum TaxID=27933 RepID=UPI0031F63A82
MRIVLRSGGIYTSDPSSSEREGSSHGVDVDDGYSVQPSLTTSSSRAQLNPALNTSGQGECVEQVCSSGEQGAAVNKQPRPQRKPGTGSLACVVLLVACLAVIVFQATKPSGCVSWNSRPNLLQTVEEKLATQLTGQDLAIEIILHEIRSFVNKPAEQRSKPLVLVLYGPSGTGKTLAAEVLRRHLMFSREKQISSGKRYFVPDHYHSEAKRCQGLISNILQDSRLCKHGNVFVLEDLDLAKKTDWLEDLAPLFSGQTYWQHGHAYSFSNAIFILTVRTASAELVQQSSRLRKSGVARDSPDYSGVMESMLTGENPSVEYLGPVRRYVDAFVPFLPLEKEHVAYCVSQELKQTGQDVTKEAMDYALSLAGFPARPDAVSGQFSEHGCKKVPLYVALAPAE